MAEEKKGFFKRLVSGLTKTRDNIVAGFDSLFTGYSTIDDDFYEELEEILIMAGSDCWAARRRSSGWACCPQSWAAPSGPTKECVIAHWSSVSARRI